MTIYILVGSILLLFALGVAVKSLTSNSKQQDSMLKQRAIFNINEQLTFTRLKEILPNRIVLAHVSYDALLTTKYHRTRNKYQNMIADFVVLDEFYQVIAVVAVDDVNSLRHVESAEYKDALLTMAGYQVFRYDDVPEYYQLRQDFTHEKTSSAQEMPIKHHVHYHLARRKNKALS